MLVILELLCRCFINLVQRSSSEFTALRTRTGLSLNQNRWSGPEFGQRGRTELKVQFRVQKIYLVNQTEPDFDTTTCRMSGWTFHIPVSQSIDRPILENHSTRAHGYCLPLYEKEKNNRMCTTFIPRIPKFRRQFHTHPIESLNQACPATHQWMLVFSDHEVHHSVGEVWFETDPNSVWTKPKPSFRFPVWEIFAQTEWFGFRFRPSQIS